MPTTIIHITTRQAWAEALEQGAYRAESLEREGFIHCSTPAQVIQVANIFYHGQTGLVLLRIDADKLTAPLRYEPPFETAADEEHFPHVYGVINLEAVTGVYDFPPSDEGTFTLPDGADVTA